MAEFLELRAIDEQKRLLRAHCELTRRSLELEVSGLREGTARMCRGAGLVTRYRTLLLAVAPVLGLLVARQGWRARRWLMRGVAVWQVFSRLFRWAGVLRGR
jgi:hypothetical protein